LRELAKQTREALVIGKPFVSLLRRTWCSSLAVDLLGSLSWVESSGSIPAEPRQFALELTATVAFWRDGIDAVLLLPCPLCGSRVGCPLWEFADQASQTVVIRKGGALVCRRILLVSGALLTCNAGGGILRIKFATGSLGRIVFPWGASGRETLQLIIETLPLFGSVSCRECIDSSMFLLNQLVDHILRIETVVGRRVSLGSTFKLVQSLFLSELLVS
jgi:hypothetical protein